MATVWKSAAATGPANTSNTTWQNMDVSGDADWTSSMGAVILDISVSATSDVGLRADTSTSTTSTFAMSDGSSHSVAIVPLTAGGLYEQYSGTYTSVSTKVLGFIESGDIGFDVDPEELTVASSNSWLDVTPDTGTDTPVAFFGFISSGGTDTVGIRPKGSTDSTINGFKEGVFFVMPCDANGKMQMNTPDSPNVKMYIMGWLTNADNYDYKTNGVEHSATVASTYQTKTATTDATGVLGLGTTSNTSIGVQVRPPSETSYPSTNIYFSQKMGALATRTNSAASHQFEIYTTNTTSRFYEYIASYVGLDYQYAYPASDISDGAWVLSTTDAAGALYTMLDETTASDTDFIYVESNSTSEVKFGTWNAPDTSEEVKVSYRYRAAAGANNVTVSLWRGATQVTSASWAHTSIGATYVQADQVLTTAQKNEITTNSAWSDLRLRFVSSGF